VKGRDGLFLRGRSRGVTRLLLVLAALAFAGCAAPMLGGPLAPASTAEPTLRALPPVQLPTTAPVFEPSVASDGAGNLFVTASHPFDAMHLWASHDNGTSFAEVPAMDGASMRDLPAGAEGQPAVAPDGTVYAADLYLGSVTLMASADHGKTWELRSVVSTRLAGGDRPWLAAGPNGSVYLAWNQIPTGFWVAASHDGGRTFPTQTMFPGTEMGAGEFVVPGVPAVGPDGALYVARNGAEGPSLFVSRDGGQTFQRTLAWKASGPVGWLFTTAAVDAAGNVYVTSAEQKESGTRVLWAVSRDGGRSFDPPREATAAPGIHVHPWSAAGAKGRLALAFYENPNGTGTPDAADGDWYLRVVVVDGADTATPVAREARVVAQPVHHGAVCTRGTPYCERECAPLAGCVSLGNAPERHLGDYLGVAADLDGSVHVVFQDTTKDETVWYARVLADG